MLFWEILFWFCFLSLLHTYVLFPLLLELLTIGKKQNPDVYNDPGEFPSVSILLAVFNEEKVIRQKIESTFSTGYPKDKIEFLIGSDTSTDGTERIIEEFQRQYPQIKLHRFEARTGKSGIINTLAEKAQNEILILTDANVFFRDDTIFHLTKHYRNESIGIIGGNILNTIYKKDGISRQEKTYLTRENKIKYQEGIIWGTMIGAFGGCYSIRKVLYSPVPAKFFMDDFYITMNVLEHGSHAINELDALCDEDVSNKISEEFRRKVRISIGNFQNLSSYKHLLWPPWTGLGFSFLSHKVLRWTGPFFIILLLISNAVLSTKSEFYSWFLLAQVAALLLPLLDTLLKSANIHVTLLRFASHFYLMNLALLIGFFKFLRGVESNIWRPTQRNQ
jgi:cellulose synthase/poly-beta-1,6-N-acetylglucosamine synthase-like glycosyltransferase